MATRPTPNWVVQASFVLVLGVIAAGAALALGDPVILIVGIVVIAIGAAWLLAALLREAWIRAASDPLGGSREGPLLTRRIRHAFFGGDRVLTERLSSSLRNAGRGTIGGLVPGPGPFETPPPEPIELDQNELPWELRDDE